MPAAMAGVLRGLVAEAGAKGGTAGAAMAGCASSGTAGRRSARRGLSLPEKSRRRRLGPAPARGA